MDDDDSSVSDGRKVGHVDTLLEDDDDDSSASDGRKVFHVSTLLGDDDSSSASFGFRTAGDTSATTALMAASYLTQSPILRMSADAFRTRHRTPSSKPTNAVRRLLPRRAVLGLGAGAFFWAQSANMSLTNRGNSFLASARPSSPIERVLKDVEWPEQFPFKEEDFQRFDESLDSLFYEAPRFVTHIDDPAIAALTKYYSRVLPPSNTPGVSILDMCSSWVSHYPKGYKQERIVGMGMNEDELKRNPVLTEYILQDLNVDPKLPFEDNSFDAITNVVSVDYLTKPLDIFKEMSRILKPGGQAIMSFSNRCFWSKAISIWTSTGDMDHVMIVGAYFHYAGGFKPPQAVDISPNPGRSDPMYVVYSTKVSSA